ncbi:MAG: YlxR family protein [Peptostreptococcaceae bacterium]|nr:YlxR family protein [Peptostreptococcaceae bacterium]
MKKKKVPIRKCINCFEQSTKKTLLRIVKTKDNEVFLDKTGKANGRGAYVCDLNCLEEAIKKRALQRAFKIEIKEEVINKIKEDMKDGK